MQLRTIYKAFDILILICFALVLIDRRLKVSLWLNESIQYAPFQTEHFPTRIITNIPNGMKSHNNQTSSWRNHFFVKISENIK